MYLPHFHISKCATGSRKLHISLYLSKLLESAMYDFVHHFVGFVPWTLSAVGFIKSRFNSSEYSYLPSTAAERSRSATQQHTSRGRQHLASSVCRSFVLQSTNDKRNGQEGFAVRRASFGLSVTQGVGMRRRCGLTSPQHSAIESRIRS